MYMGTYSEARKIYQWTHWFSQQQAQSLDRRQRSFSRPRYDPRPRYNGYDNRSRFDRFKSPGGRREESGRHDQSWTQPRPPYSPPIWCIGYKFDSCYKSKKTLDEIKELINKKLYVKIVNPDPAGAVNLCKNSAVAEDMAINYTYTDLWRQMMILDIGAPVSIAGVSWIKQY